MSLNILGFGGDSKMAQQTEGLLCMADGLESTQRYRSRTGSRKLSSDLHVSSVACSPKHTQVSQTHTHTNAQTHTCIYTCLIIIINNNKCSGKVYYIHFGCGGNFSIND